MPLHTCTLSRNLFATLRQLIKSLIPKQLESNCILATALQETLCGKFTPEFNGRNVTKKRQTMFRFLKSIFPFDTAIQFALSPSLKISLTMDMFNPQTASRFFCLLKNIHQDCAFKLIKLTRNSTRALRQYECSRR